MIPQETIEQIRQSTDIVQIIGEYLRLKKRGRNFLALCPFHTEKTASFSVSSDKQIFHCFGCGKGGNVFSFLMEHEKMSFVEAVKLLAAKTNIQIKDDYKSDYNRQVADKIYYANSLAVEFYHKQLMLPKYSGVLKDYLFSKRKIKPETVEQFSIGLAGEEWEGFVNYARSKDLKGEDLQKAGLATRSEKNQKYYDRFRQRLMFPIFNLSQKPIAFGGRTLKKGEPAKYINSPETSLYIKGNVLYGLNYSKDAIRDSGSVFVVEGYFDFISLWQAGIKNVVASSGTAFTLNQARLLARFAENVYLFFDSDSAGRKAALNSVDSLYDAGLEVKVIEAASGQDPDSIAREDGKDKIMQLVESAPGFIPFKLKEIDLTGAGIIEKEKLVKEISEVGSNISDPTRRALFFSEASNLMGVELNLFLSQVKKSDKDVSLIPSAKSRFSPIEFNLLSLLFNNPGNIDYVLENISVDDFDSKDLARLYSALIVQYKNESRINIERLADNNSDTEFISLATEIASVEWEDSKIDEQLTTIARNFVDRKRKRIREKLKHDLAIAEQNGDTEKAELILKEMTSFGLYADKN